MARAVFKICYDGHDFATVAEHLSAGPMKVTAAWVRDMWKQYCATGDLTVIQGYRDAPPANRIIDDEAAQHLVDLLLASPEATLQEHHSEFQLTGGITIHISTFCRAVWQLGFTRQKVTPALLPSPQQSPQQQPPELLQPPPQLQLLLPPLSQSAVCRRCG